MKFVSSRTGIRKVTAKGGSETFHAIKKVYVCGVYLGHVPIYGQDWSRSVMEDNGFRTLKDAEKAIDYHLKSLELDRERKLSRKVVSKKFIKYP